MGMEQTVTFPGQEVPPWNAVRDWLERRGVAVQLRMIDGQLAFSDEPPPDAWGELRVGTPLGMVTLHRDPDRIRVVTWGNADASLRQAWNLLAWAYAAAGNGQVLAAGGPLAAEAFRQTAELPPAIRSDCGTELDSSGRP